VNNMAMMITSRVVSFNIRSCRLRAFALPGLRANAANSFLGCLSLLITLIEFLKLNYLSVVAVTSYVPKVLY